MSVIHAIEVTLNTEINATIRAATAEDVDALVAIESLPPEDGDLSFRHESARPPEHRRSGLGHWVRWHRDEPGMLCLVAIVNDAVVGYLNFGHTKDQYHQHRGVLDMFLIREWRGQGVGSALIDSLLTWATKNAQIEIVGLNVISANEGAMRLYEKYGFVEEGRLRRAIRLPNGDYADEVLMSKHL